MLLTARLQFSMMMQPPFYTYDQPGDTSLRTTFKPTSVHCEERSTNRTTNPTKHELTPPGYAHLFGGAREPIRTLPFGVRSVCVSLAGQT